MAGGGLPTGTITFVFTDLEGSTHLLQRLGDRYPNLLATHYELMRAAFGANRGHEVGTRRRNRGAIRGRLADSLSHGTVQGSAVLVVVPRSR